jgi:Peptidase family M1 domain/Immune inhibitor A peptidase M6/Peptidase M1 N-terminal domain
MRRVLTIMMAAALCAATLSAAATDDGFTPGAPGIGDPYFPLAGNGGYDVTHYRLGVGYDPATDVLTGVATVTADATQDLSSFNLDFEGLTVRSISVNGVAAGWARDGGELTIAPAAGIPTGTRFRTVVRYDGVPETLPDQSGFFHTDDGALVIGQPAVAATWFPVNDHPLDKAAYTFVITAPTGLEVVSNGVLRAQRTTGATTTWTWVAREPMAPYLAMMAIGEFDVDAYDLGSIRVRDAIDPDLFTTELPRTGDQFAYSQQGDFGYKRLARTISVPPGGAELSFWIDRDTEQPWDFVFVEAHTPGQDDWTTLPDINGHTSEDTGFSCPGSHDFHPFLTHYQGPGCEPEGTTGVWWAATGESDGYEEWSFDLGAYAGGDVEVSITYVTDFSITERGVVVDDVAVSTGEGSTSFEADGNTFDGWTTPGAPEGSAPNPNDWIAATVDDLPPTEGAIAAGSLARQGEVLAFLQGVAGAYPFGAAGGIVDDLVELGFALETQTRPIYARSFFTDSISGDAVVVHELAHQWFGDSLAVGGWQHIWLNEGFASYAEWLWSEEEGLGTAEEVFEFWVSVIPSRDPFWDVVIGDPGPSNLFNFAIYIRGAMTLHVLRLNIGDEPFFRLLREWSQTNAGGNVTTDQFIALAESISGEELDDLFEEWLFTARKPSRPIVTQELELSDAPPVARAELERLRARNLLD